MSSGFDIDTLRHLATSYFDRVNLSSPAFLDESTVAILDDRTGTPQLCLLDTSTLELTPLTGFPDRILTLRTSPAGNVVFGMDSAGNERQQVWIIDELSRPARQVTSSPEAIHEPGVVSADGTFALMATNARDAGTFDIIEVDLASGKLTPWWQSAGTASPLAVTFDGRQALVERGNTNLDADVWLLDRETGERRNLTEHDGEAWILGAAFGPDERDVWVLTNEGREFVRLERINLESGNRTVVVERDWDIEAFSVSPSGSHVAMSVNVAGSSSVSIINLNGEALETPIDGLGHGTVDRFSWSPDGSLVAFGHSTAETPSRIVLAATDGTFRITQAEDAPPPTSHPELIHYTSFDDLKVSGFLFRPAGEGPFPVVVEVHGGPESQRRLQYASAVPTNQFICSLGIAVLSLNVRGSIGYGKRYSHLDDVDLRLDAVRDVVEAVTWLRTREDVIHDRIAIMGQSYGGFLTLASIAFHPDLWAAAVDVVGIANFVSFLERTGPWRRERRSQEYGFLERDRDLLERISPLNHVDSILAPLFVIHGRNDPRVPLFEAEQIVSALESRDRTVEYLVFDDEGHGLARRANRIDGYAAAARFLARHLLA